MEQKVKIPCHAALALEALEQAGFEAWCVGGCVRDSLLGLAPSDWDVATNALPEETKACFRDLRVIETGIRHGTVTVLLEGKPVEITTYRADGPYTDHRHPDAVGFSRRLEDDLSRRDFTVNAMACHPKRGLVDKFGGLSDLESETLRCVGDPERRFEEDALRILRCLRFSSSLGFSIERSTARALEEKRELLENVSWERVREELTKLLCGQNAGSVLRQYGGVVYTVLPELSPMAGCAQENPFHCFDVWEHTLRALDAVLREPILRWAALLHDCGKPASKFYDEKGVAHFYGHEKRSVEIGGGILDKLKFSGRDKEDVLALVKCHGEIYPIAEKRLKKLLGRLGEEQVLRLFRLSRADLSAQAPELYEQRIGAIRQTEALARGILAEGQCLTLRGLAVNGRDLLAMGYKAGPSLGKALEQLLDEVLEGKLPNKRPPLLKRAGELLKLV